MTWTRCATRWRSSPPPPTCARWDAVRVAVLGKSGRLTGLLKGLGQVPAEQRKERGAALNRLKGELGRGIEARRNALEEAALDARLTAERLDVTLPPRPFPPAGPSGGIHPISRTIEELTAIFGAMGFAVAEGPDIESDWHNFGALNIPDHHPARQDHDTFYLPARWRTAAARCCARTPRRCRSAPCWPRRRRSASSSPAAPTAPTTTRRTPMFHQVEGLVIDRDITLGHLKGCLIDFLRAFFGIADLPVRFRSSYFPFTEPVDGGGHRLEPEDRRARQGRRLAGDPGQRHGASARAGQLRASIRGSGRASPSAWGSSASPC